MKKPADFRVNYLAGVERIVDSQSHSQSQVSGSFPFYQAQTVA